MQLPWVSREQLRIAQATSAGLEHDLVLAQDENERLRRQLDVLLVPEEIIKRAIAEAEQKIRLAELEETLRKMKEEPDPESDRPTQPSMDRVKAIAAASRARRIPRKT